MRALRSRIYKILTPGADRDKSSQLFKVAMTLLILANTLVVLLESVTDIYLAYSVYFDYFKYFSISIFSIEYLLRLWCCAEAIPGQDTMPVSERLQFFLTPLMLFDLLAIVSVSFPGTRVFDLRLLRLFRLLSFFQVLDNSRTLKIILSVIRRERKAFTSTLLLIAVLLIFISAIIYSIEQSQQPEVFGSIPDAMWWTITTITTVGYGDAVPLNALGKMFGVLVMFLGVLMFAIPTGILVSAFYQELKRKDFLATWDLVAQVPFFSNLHALEIARITDVLSLHAVRTGETIFSIGDEADSMYFIVSGEVEINQNGRIIIERGGDFFGELGILYKAPRGATVKTRTYVELLRLDIKDLELFLELHPQLRQHILDEAEVRLARSALNDAAEE